MAILTYPLNGILYDAEDVETYLCTRTSGVFADSGHFPASVTGQREVTIGPGLAWMKNEEFHGKAVYNPENVALTIAEADAYQDRIDRIVLRFDKLLNQTTLEVLKGTPANSPKAPDITRDEYTYELGIYTVTVKKSTVSLSESNVANTFLDESVCGIMEDAVTSIPTQELYDQWYAWFADIQTDTETFETQFNLWFEQIVEESEAYMEEVKTEFEVWMNGEKVSFDEWFDTVQDTLDSDTAGKLTNLVNDAQDTADEALEQLITGTVRGFMTEEYEGGEYGLLADDSDDSHAITLSRPICDCDDMAGSDLVSDEFQSNYTYSAGDYVIYENTLYVFTADKSAGEWDWDCVKATNVGTELRNGLHYVGALTVNTDLDELFATGIYEGYNGEVPLHAPGDASSSSSIIVMVYHEISLGNDFTIQEYTNVVSSQIRKYIRRYSGTAWNDWVRCTTGAVFQSGNVNTPTPAANSYTDYTVTFSTAFVNTPTVVASLQGGLTTTDGYANIAVATTSISTTGFTIRLLNGSSRASLNPNISWIAIDMASTGSISPSSIEDGTTIAPGPEIIEPDDGNDDDDDNGDDDTIVGPNPEEVD